MRQRVSTNEMEFLLDVKQKPTRPVTGDEGEVLTSDQYV